MKCQIELISLNKELEILPTLDRNALLQKWHEHYDRDPPFKISNELLVQSIAYRMQEKVHGGLSPATRRYLLKVAADLKQGNSPLLQRRLKPGTRLIREWKGTTHEVTVLEKGYQYKSKVHRSLSEIAGLITGAHWSGPLFFGTNPSRKQSHERS